MLSIGSGAIAPAKCNTQGKKTVATKKTTRSPKSASPPPPAQEAKLARKAPAKAPTARAGRVAAPRKRPAAAAAATESTATPVVVTDEDIRVRAYFLSLEYRGSNRHDVDFWLLAERELRPSKE
jgi:hypothetical protein